MDKVTIYGPMGKGNKNTTDFKSFHYLENGDVSFSEFETIKCSPVLEPGLYSITYLEYPKDRVAFKTMRDVEDIAIFDFPEKEKIDELVNAFNTAGVSEKIQNLGFLHKVGLLLHGQEGTGKSSIIKHYCKRLIKEKNAVVIYMNCIPQRTGDCWSFIEKIRTIQDNPIVIVFDEFDVFMDRFEGTIKTIIDGARSINNVLFFACTNYLDKIPVAIKDRPSRFKYSIEIGVINKEEIIHEIVTKLLTGTCSNEEIIKISKDCVGKTLDHIKHICLNEIMNLEYKESKEKGRIGFLKN